MANCWCDAIRVADSSGGGGGAIPLFGLDCDESTGGMHRG